jgi:hypothetical protein
VTAPVTANTRPAIERAFSLCAKPDQAFFGPAIFQLGSNPVETPGNFTAIIGVFVAVESFEEEHPLISAEVNGFSGRWVSHEWAACGFLEWSVL